MPYSDNDWVHILKRAEESRNNAAKMYARRIDEGWDSVSHQAYIYLHDALMDLCAGLFEIMHIPCNDSWTISTCLKILNDIMPHFPDGYRKIHPWEFDSLYVVSSEEKWVDINAFAKSLVYYAARFSGLIKTEEQVISGYGHFILEFLRLCEHYDDNEIEAALNESSSKPGLQRLHQLTSDKANRLRNLIAIRRGSDLSLLESLKKGHWAV